MQAILHLCLFTPLLPRPVELTNLPRRANILILAEASDLLPCIYRTPGANATVSLNTLVSKLLYTAQRLRLDIFARARRAEFALAIWETKCNTVVLSDGGDLPRSEQTAMH